MIPRTSTSSWRAPEEQRVLRLRHVLTRTGLSRSTIYAWIEQGQFPSSIHLGPRAVGWLSSDVEAWLEKRVVGSRTRLETRAESE